MVGMSQKLRQVSLLFLREDKYIWLAMKKRGFGEGKWNGVGGKPELNELIEDTAVRECEEEIEVTPSNLEHVATLDLLFPPEKSAQGWDQQVVVYFSDIWDGEPKETEEMSPKRFSIEDLPFESMWDDDKLWLPKVIYGKLVRAKFHFDNSGKMVNYKIISEKPRQLI